MLVAKFNFSRLNSGMAAGNDILGIMLRNQDQMRVGYAESMHHHTYAQWR